MQQQTMVIGIAGASGAGKSRLTSQLYNRIEAEHGSGGVTVLNEDFYYRRRDQLSFEQREQINYDHPDALEHQLLVEHLRQLRNGNSIQAPQYDYATHNRTDQTVLIEPTRLIILEGILILHVEPLRSLLDLKIFVDVPMDICLARRIRRDTQERGRSLESILTQYETTVRPMFYEFINPTKSYADILIPNGGENPQAISVLGNHLSTLWNKE